MHEIIATVDPATALAVGLKVDVEALPRTVIAALRAGEVDLTNPAVTVGSTCRTLMRAMRKITKGNSASSPRSASAAA
jgi:hypothetical protein